MKISELPTPRLRARAMELAKLYNEEYEDFELTDAFLWSATTEKVHFWLLCSGGNWDKAKELQPSLFKPMDGKPHIKLQGMYGLGMDSDEALFLGYALDSITEDPGIHSYLLKVQPSLYSTIKEAVEALYSFKREENL